MSIKQKYIEKGYSSLTDIEFMQLILELTGCKNSDLKARQLIEKYGSTYNIMSKGDGILEISKIKNDKFFIMINLIKDFTKQNLFEKIKKSNNITSNTKDVINYLKSELIFRENEIFGMLLLNNRYEVIKFEKLSYGTIDRSCIFMRKILSIIVECNAKNVIIAHNHPSGSLVPSENDRRLTLKIKKALDMFEINLADHIIVSKLGYYSFAEGGII